MDVPRGSSTRNKPLHNFSLDSEQRVASLTATCFIGSRNTLLRTTEHALPADGVRSFFARIAYFRPKGRLLQENAGFFTDDLQMFTSGTPFLGGK